MKEFGAKALFSLKTVDSYKKEQEPPWTEGDAMYSLITICPPPPQGVLFLHRFKHSERVDLTVRLASERTWFRRLDILSSTPTVVQRPTQSPLWNRSNRTRITLWGMLRKSDGGTARTRSFLLAISSGKRRRTQSSFFGDRLGFQQVRVPIKLFKSVHLFQACEGTSARDQKVLGSTGFNLRQGWVESWIKVEATRIQLALILHWIGDHPLCLEPFQSLPLFPQTGPPTDDKLHREHLLDLAQPSVCL
ncbi:hypothetical protein G6F37_006294 [Rhizopus arrhizus]|nr:hypothetical protein G6F38_009397 [Rhizopus arrhizus]KAG1157893.1 hypothetical protein G6F37_006294 [Rhizopus arrhizus]